MAKENGLYKCSICGNVVSVIEAHAGTLVCCGKEMLLMEEKSAAMEGKEKHVPVIEPFEGGVKVKVGSIPHPMEEKHYIELIQLIKDDEIVIGKRLKPGEKPEAVFCGITYSKDLKARELCNIHGLWRN